MTACRSVGVQRIVQWRDGDPQSPGRAARTHAHPTVRYTDTGAAYVNVIDLVTSEAFKLELAKMQRLVAALRADGRL